LLLKKPLTRIHVWRGFFRPLFTVLKDETFAAACGEQESCLADVFKHAEHSTDVGGTLCSIPLPLKSTLSLPYVRLSPSFLRKDS
jgi:hypothetical protein